MKLGDELKDTVTGFKGVAVSHHRYLNGCERFTLQPRELKDGKPVEPHTFDIEQLELYLAAPERTVTPSGGPHDEPSRPSIPSR